MRHDWDGSKTLVFVSPLPFRRLMGKLASPSFWLLSLAPSTVVHQQSMAEHGSNACLLTDWMIALRVYLAICLLLRLQHLRRMNSDRRLL